MRWQKRRARRTQRDDRQSYRPELPNNFRHLYKRNGQIHAIWRHDSEAHRVSSSLDRFVDLYRHHAAVVARYRAERQCTEKQLKTIEALYIDGMSLQEFARREGIKPQAVTSRLSTLQTKTPEFSNWWNNLNRGRSRRGQSPEGRPHRPNRTAH